MTYPTKFFIDELQGITPVLKQTHWFRLSEGNYLIRWSNNQGLVRFSTCKLPTQVEPCFPEMPLSMFLPMPCDFYRDLKLQEISPEWKRILNDPLIKLPTRCVTALVEKLALDRLRVLINSARISFSRS